MRTYMSFLHAWLIRLVCVCPRGSLACAGAGARLRRERRGRGTAVYLSMKQLPRRCALAGVEATECGRGSPVALNPEPLDPNP